MMMSYTVGISFRNSRLTPHLSLFSRLFLIRKSAYSARRNGELVLETHA